MASEITGMSTCPSASSNIDNKLYRKKRISKFTQISRINMILYGVIVCLLSLIQCPLSSTSSSIIEDVASPTDMFDSNDGYFTSNLDLQKLLSTEEAIMFELQEYVRNEEKRLEKLNG